VQILKFEINEEIVDGELKRVYIIDKKPVSEEVYDKLSSDRLEKSKNEKAIEDKKKKRLEDKKKEDIKDNVVDFKTRENDECEDGCCDRCQFIKTVISDIKEVSDEEAFSFLNDILDQIEQEALDNGIRMGIEVALRQSIESMNQMLYHVDDLVFEVSEQEYFDE
jgi:phosphopantetheine adenylyltransferase